MEKRSSKDKSKTGKRGHYIIIEVMRGQIEKRSLEVR